VAINLGTQTAWVMSYCCPLMQNWQPFRALWVGRNQ
jgi:hypothetical protein